MLADKKPEKKKEEEKEPVRVIPARKDTPKLLKAALEMTEKSGLRGTLAKLKGRMNNKSCVSSQVHTHTHTQEYLTGPFIDIIIDTAN